jgi:carboxypeptidase T
MKRFKIILGILILFVCFSSSYGQQKQELYSRAKIYLDAKNHTMMDLSALGVAVDHGDYRKNNYFISDFSATEIGKIKNAGFNVDVIIADVSKYYSEQNSKPATQKKTTSVPCDTAQMPVINVPSHFHLGSYGGYFTYNEMLAILDSMTLLYPNLISAKQQIDTFHSVEGRIMYWLRVSNNPGVNQSAKPQILYTAVHHAREPGSLSATIFYLWYLLENYNTDPQVKAIIDNTELYFIPCVNPDGYVYNIQTNPFGGGMWRKNRRNNLNGSYGIDPNRNYGYLWGYDNVGSSNNTSDETYRGPSAFSEPETRAVKWFTEQHNFELALNYHTFNNELINPFGHLPVVYTPDSLQFSAYSFLLTGFNFYRYGTCYQCLGYVTNGASDDWMYGDVSTKNKVFAWTPEIGDVQYGFYPPSYQIIPDCKANLLPNIHAAALLLPYAKLRSTDPNILTKTSGYLHYNMQRMGVTNVGTYTVSAIPLSSYITIPSPTNVHNNPFMLQNVSDSFSYTLDANTPNGQAIRYALKVNNGYYDMTDTVEFFYGKYNTEISPAMGSFIDWTNSGWSINTNKYHSAPSSFKSGPTNGNYPDNSSVTLELKDTINLKYAVKAYVQFYTRWDIEPKYDYLTVNASEYGQSNWNALCGKFTKPGSYTQPVNAPIYDDHQYDWVLEQMDLGDYLGKKIQLQFDLESDQAQNYEGFYVDDLKIVTVQDSNVSVKDISKGSVAIYPNPSQGEITIDFSGTNMHNAKAILFDCLGRQMDMFTISAAKTNIDLGSYPANLYFLKLYDDNGSLPMQKIELLK